MELNEKQKQGLQIAVDRYNQGFKYTVIAGYAGTGKSTLVKFIISALPNIDPEIDVVYTSFTGKATQVLQKKGNKNVSTLHKLLFESIPRPDGTFFRKPVEIVPYKVVIVDECSMVPKDLLQRLASYSVHIICLGDPGRQEAESEIIKLTMDIRDGKPLNHYIGQQVQILDKDELTTGMLEWADQIICATNATRVALNNQMRNLLGHEGEPEDGDKVICLKNNWEIFSDDENPLVNGTIGYLRNSFSTYINLPARITGDNKAKKLDIIKAEFVSDTGESYGDLDMDKKLILTGEPGLDWKTSYKMRKNWKYMNMVPEQFTYGYAITCHKAQGSEWDKVLVIDGGSFGQENRGEIE